MEKTSSTSVSELIGTWQKKMFWLMWVTYASFYLCRVNISIALPEIAEEFSLTKTNIGLVLSSLFLLYAIGQFINGQLGDKLNSRPIIALGLLSSAMLNIIFGFSGGVLGFMIVIWGLNGYFQSMGWGPTVKAMANWFYRCNGILRGKFDRCGNGLFDRKVWLECWFLLLDSWSSLCGNYGVAYLELQGKRS